MDLQIHCTQDGVKKYPLHKHNHYEVMLYLHDTGHLLTKDERYPFSPGSIIIVPPCVAHGSASCDGFKNISVCGAFDYAFHYLHPVTLRDNAHGEGKFLATMIYNHRYENSEYLLHLCATYAHFLLQNIKNEDDMSVAVRGVINYITNHFSDCNIDLRECLNESGYAEDYIRAHFKKHTGKTPNTFLTDLRIKHATSLIEIYAGGLSLAQIAEKCGYTDYIYFSKKFKSVTGMSPKAYKNSILSR